MTPYKYQIDMADKAYDILKKYGLVYIAAEERTGKTLASILLAEKTNRTNILVLTKKKALGGWNDTIREYFGVDALPLYKGYRNSESGKSYTIFNYHQACKLDAEYDLIILDESHSYLSAYPKTGKIWRDVARLSKGQPIVYLSATPYAQGPQLLFNQFKLSSWSPWKQYRNFYDWFRHYGVPTKIRTPYGLVESYTKVLPATLSTVQHLFITKTRKELKFAYEPSDVLHYVQLSEQTRSWYNKCLKDEMLRIPELDIESPLDSPMKLRTTLHMLEGGVAKVEDKYYILPNKEKIDEIKKDFGDTKDVVIMYNYIAEGKKLSQHFKSATLLQATSYAEGVDLSNFKILIIYSQDFSTARHSQRRARQANKERDSEIKVHFYLVKDAVSEQVYKTVSLNKKNFIDSLFDRKEIE